MRKLLAVTLAVLFGFLAMIIPITVWHQVRFPDKPPTLHRLREETMNSPQASWYLSGDWNKWARWSITDSTSTFPIYITFVVSLLVSVSVYLLYKRRSLKTFQR